ncbi:MAG: hypothetical protein J6R47_06605 [Acholeplasmatales bacterium]|nr:hypothetical protein [Acholeplasmatales bacterium]
MTKLEEKLLQLEYEVGYEEWDENKEYLNASKYGINRGCTINIRYRNGKFFDAYLYRPYFTSQQDIANLQQAFNILQKDLEVLKEYDNN